MPATWFKSLPTWTASTFPKRLWPTRKLPRLLILKSSLLPTTWFSNATRWRPSYLQRAQGTSGGLFDLSFRSFLMVTGFFWSHQIVLLMGDENRSWLTKTSRKCPLSTWSTSNRRPWTVWNTRDRLFGLCVHATIVAYTGRYVLWPSSILQYLHSYVDWTAHKTIRCQA